MQVNGSVRQSEKKRCGCRWTIETRLEQVCLLRLVSSTKACACGWITVGAAELALVHHSTCLSDESCMGDRGEAGPVNPSRPVKPSRPVRCKTARCKNMMAEDESVSACVLCAEHCHPCSCSCREGPPAAASPADQQRRTLYLCSCSCRKGPPAAADRADQQGRTLIHAAAAAAAARSDRQRRTLIRQAQSTFPPSYKCSKG